MNIQTQCDWVGVLDGTCKYLGDVNLTSANME